MRPRLLICLFAAVLAGCQSWLTLPRSVRPLAAPLSERHHVEHLLEINWDQQSQRLHCVLITAPGETRVVALTETGLPVFQLLQTPGKIDINRSPLLPRPVSPDVILADIQLIFWPIDSLQKTLSPPWRLEQNAGSRDLYEGETLRAHVDYQGKERWNSPATLDNRQYGYRLTVTPLNSAPQATP